MPKPTLSTHGKRLLTLLLVLLVVTGITWWLRQRPGSATRPGVPADVDAMAQKMAAAFITLEARETQITQTIWAKELLAEQCGRVFETLWDGINSASNKLAVAAEFPFGEMLLPRYGVPQRLPHQILEYDPEGAGSRLDVDAWRKFVSDFQSAGWQLERTEFRHQGFKIDAADQPQRSTFWFSAKLRNPARSERATLAGDLMVDWSASRTPEGLPGVQRIDASRLELMARSGELPFEQILNETIAPPEKSHFIDPLILYDLDGDGHSEIILAAKNLLYRRQPDGSFTSKPLCRYAPGLIFTAVVADFDGDGIADFLCAKFDGLYLFKGSPGGPFDEPGRQVWKAQPHLKYGQVLTCGDIDGDGNLDVWLGQYKSPYIGGQMPTPYYDANDGNPSYLLRNDGHGNFTDVTDASGLGAKRWRRTYSASLVDLDGDGDLDLIVVSDFAGIDLYTNDGHGHFTDVTGQWLAEPRAFGMAHTFADFNADGRLDFLVTGMDCATPQRLDQLGLSRPERPDYAAMRSRMVAGNRLGLAQAAGGFAPLEMGNSIARSGWSWGCTAFDLDNDGFPDVYIATGHETCQLVNDYETEFWLHDIYLGTSTENAVIKAIFGAKYGRRRAQRQSYGGWEINKLYLNRNGHEFVEAGYLLGIGLPLDSRCVVADDLDGDGRVDLLVTTFEFWPVTQQTLRVFQNKLTDGGNWISFQLREEPGKPSPVGAQVTVHYTGGVQAKSIITGDSHRAQHANTMHFGLGNVTAVDTAEIRWPAGELLRLEKPAVNRTHRLSAPTHRGVR